MTEELLEVHEAEISRLKYTYEQHKDLYEKVARRMKLWDEYLDLEVVFLYPSRLLLLELYMDVIG